MKTLQFLSKLFLLSPVLFFVCASVYYAHAQTATSPWMEVNAGVRLYTTRAGIGRPVVFLPGWPAGAELFESNFAQLSKQGIECIGFDPRGFGRSDKPEQLYNEDVFADDLHEVLRKLNLKDVILVGHSLGGAVAARYVAKYKGERVAKLVLVAAAGPRMGAKEGLSGGVDPKIFDGFVTAIEQDRPAFFAGFLDNFFAQKPSAAKLNWLLSGALQASPSATTQAIAAVKVADLTADCALIKVPTYILHGKNDHIVPFTQAEEWHKAIAGSEVIEFETGGHGLFSDEADKFNREVLRIARQ